MKPDVKMTDEDEREADESVLSAETSTTSTSTGLQVQPAKYRLIDTAKYYIVEEDVSDDEDIDAKHYTSPTYQRYHLEWSPIPIRYPKGNGALYSVLFWITNGDQLFGDQL